MISIMNQTMTSSANRNDIKPMSFIVTAKMMITLCLSFAQFASVISCWKYFPSFNSMIDGIHSPFFFRMIFDPSYSSFLIYKSSFFAFVISFLIGFIIFLIFISQTIFFDRLYSFHAFSIFLAGYFSTRFALPLISILCGSVLIEIIQCFTQIATRTSFCYNRFRHDSFSFLERLCLGPVARYSLAVGSLYSNNSLLHIKEKYHEQNRPT